MSFFLGVLSSHGQTDRTQRLRAHCACAHVGSKNYTEGVLEKKKIVLEISSAPPNGSLMVVHLLIFFRPHHYNTMQLDIVTEPTLRFPTVCMRSHSIQPIYVVSLFCTCSIQNTDDIVQTHIFQDKHLSFCLCPPCWKNDLNIVVGIDDIKGTSIPLCSNFVT